MFVNSYFKIFYQTAICAAQAVAFLDTAAFVWYDDRRIINRQEWSEK